MSESSPRARAVPFAVGLSLAIALVSGQAAAISADRNPGLAIDEDGCRFSPSINRALSLLPQHSDMQMHTEGRAARFVFGGLHGVGVVKKWDAEWSEDRLYFREDLPALKATLRRMGFRVDRGGRVALPAAAKDVPALYVEAKDSGGRHFAEARSYLACGGV